MRENLLPFFLFFSPFFFLHLERELSGRGGMTWILSSRREDQSSWERIIGKMGLEDRICFVKIFITTYLETV